MREQMVKTAEITNKSVVAVEDGMNIFKENQSTYATLKGSSEEVLKVIEDLSNVVAVQKDKTEEIVKNIHKANNVVQSVREQADKIIKIAEKTDASLHKIWETFYIFKLGDAAILLDKLAELGNFTAKVNDVVKAKFVEDLNPDISLIAEVDSLIRSLSFQNKEIAELLQKYPELRDILEGVEDDLFEVKLLLKELFVAMNNDDLEEIKGKEQEISDVVNRISERLIKAIAEIVLSKQKSDERA